MRSAFPRPFPLPSLVVLAALLAGCAVPAAERGTVEPPTDTETSVDAEAPASAADEPVRWVRPADAERQRGLALLRQGGAAERRGDVAAAVAAYDGAADALPAFRGWAGVLAAGAAAKAGDTAAARRQVEALPEGPAREWGWRVQTDALRRARDTAAATAAAERAFRALPAGPGRAAAALEAGRMRLSAGDGERARPLLAQAAADAPESGDGLEAARLAADLPLTPAERLPVGRALLRHGGVDRGVAALRAWLASGAGTAAERAAVQLEAGTALFGARRYTQARGLLEPAAALLPEAGVLAGRAAIRQRQGGAASTLLRTAAARAPESPAAAEAWLLLGDVSREAGQPGAARELYRQAIATGAHTTHAAEAATRLALLAAAGGRLPSVLPDLEAYFATRPRDEQAAAVLYWAGRAHLAAGRRAEAEARFREALAAGPVTFHGIRAAERLDTPLRIPTGRVVPQVRPASEDEVDAAFWRMDLLRELERTDEAAWELARVRRAVEHEPAALLLVAEEMGPRGQPIAGSVLGRGVQRELGGWDERLMRIVHPFPEALREGVFREARRHGLDPYTVAGLIRQESYFSPNARSSAGALGLMQVMPATGRGLARGAGIRDFTPEMLRDPDVNLRLGTRFLAEQWRRWNGRQADVFAAYNAGPGRVVRWRRFPEHGDEDLFVERVPFAETRDYVKRVRTYAHVYRALYGGE